MAGAWPGWDEIPQPVIFNGRPGRARPRHGSEHMPQPVYYVGGGGQYLVPAPGLGGHHRSNSSTGHRVPAQIIINNDNNVQWEEERERERRPRSSHGHHHYDHEDYIVERIHHRERSRSHSRRRHRSSTPDSIEEKVEIKGRLHRLEELERQAAEEEHEKRVKEQLLLKQAKEREAAEKKKKEDDELKKKAFEEWEKKEKEKKELAEKKKKDEEEFKKKAVEEWEKKEKEKKEKEKKAKEEKEKEEEEFLRKTLRANGYSESDIDKIIKRSKDGGKGKEKEKEKEKEHHHHTSTALTPARPTYIKVAVKHLDPETLNEYRLPWEYDDVSEAEWLFHYVYTFLWLTLNRGTATISLSSNGFQSMTRISCSSTRGRFENDVY